MASAVHLSLINHAGSRLIFPVLCVAFREKNDASKVRFSDSLTPLNRT